ncbi:dynamin-binding protein-like [Neocloeon triangulifer]|uniref:dynamin-binding protein-like n=1 Tax=Neocloeon triangulifer TaxID=2078957 RepID=UPI00286F705B|nr:dynamin-binding protein-like [Neocloeon triangulifer]
MPLIVSRVVKDFLTTTPDELCVSKGDIVLVISKSDRIWCECRLLPGDQQGRVPLGHLSELQPPFVEVGQVLFVTVSDFVGQQTGDLTIFKGDFVIGTHKIDDNWWNGQCNRVTGMFPVSYVFQLDTEQEKLRRARVKTSMRAQLEEEVDLQEGDIVTVERTVDKAYFYGCSQGKSGIFPSAFVEVLEEGPSLAVASPYRKSDLPPAYVENLPPPYRESMAQDFQPTAQQNNQSAKGLASAPQNQSDMGMQPYCVGLFPFTAQFDNELSFGEGEIIMMSCHVDQDWIKGSCNGRQGIFPASFVNIVVDCPSSSKDPSGLTVGGFAKLIFDFQAQTSGDVTVREGETVFLMYPTGDDQWWMVKKADGTSGLCPSNYLEHLKFDAVSKSTPTSSLEDLAVKNLNQLSLSKPQSLPSRNSQTSRLSLRPLPPSSPPPSPPKSDEEPELQLVEPIRPIVPPIHERHEQESLIRVPHRAPPPIQQVQKPAEQPQINEETTDDLRNKMWEQRQNVITELVLTERDFIRDLKITYETFNLHNPQILESRGVDANLLFGNILEVIKVSESLLDKVILAMKGKSEDKQLIAPSFLGMAEEMKNVYTSYCINNDNSLMLLSKYGENEDIQKLFRKGIETLQMQISCFDMSSIIIKPVQRIMKYPLILNELYKCTDDAHPDKAGLLVAVKTMSEVASYINEAKRRQDIVSRYLGDGTSSLSLKMSRFSLHSVTKKSSRLSAKLSSTLGISNTVRDEAFNEQARVFLSLGKSIRSFHQGIESVLFHIKEAVSAQLGLADAISDFFDDKSANNVDFKEAQNFISKELLQQFISSLQKYVLDTLNIILELALGPLKLIEKRNDKLADYEALMSKAEKLKDPKTQDDLNLAKHTYEALNSQLLEELPTFCVHAEDIFIECVMSYIVARKIFSAKAAKPYLNLMELPVMAGFARDSVEVFKVKHNLVCDEMSNKLSFVSKTFKSENFGTLKSNRKTSTCAESKIEEHSQSTSRTAYLFSKYPLEKIFKVVEPWSKSEILDLSVQEGDLVAAIKQQDPMGSGERWFVDDGENKGFVAQRCLQQYLINSSPQTSVGSCDETDITYEEVEEEDIYEEIPDEDFFYAEYNFDPINNFTLKLTKGQVLKVINKYDQQGNEEWWYVENRSGGQGYVPANYLKKYSGA